MTARPVAACRAQIAPGAGSIPKVLARLAAAAVLGALAVSSASATARAAATGWVGNKHASVRLITGTDDVGADGTLKAGLEFRLAPGWHGYWRTPGDAGIAPVVGWSASDNVATATIAWPPPRRLVVEGLQNSVYEGQFILPVTLRLKTPHATARIRAAIDYAACSNVCVPYQANLALELQAGPGTASAEAESLEAARAAVPGTPASAGIDVAGLTTAESGPHRQLLIDLRSSRAPFVLPDIFVEGAGDGIPAAPTVELRDKGQSVRLTVALAASERADRPLTLTFVDGSRTVEFSVPQRPVAPPGRLGWWAALSSALLGGLILNLMPCVLPVLSIKLLGLTRHAGAGRRAVRLGLVATALGIMSCFGLIAAALVGLKVSGATLGWGIQFQQPWFLAVMATVTVLFAASFFDWLPIALPHIVTRHSGSRSRGPLVEAFLIGAFATLLATPCSAPFVGTAVGFALAQGPAEIIAVFLCLGAGMALPYWAGALTPGLMRWLPRPGPWMLVLRQGLGIMLLGTALWLLVVLWSTAGPRLAATIGALLAGLLAYRAVVKEPIGLGADRRWPKIVTALLAVAPLGASLALASAPPAEATSPGWQAFDPAALDGLVADGKTVLVDVTATWCLTCKVNELAALDRPAVADRLAGPGIVRMRADWSRPDPVIAGYLQEFGRFGIPLDVVYGPRRPKGEALPELLSPKTVLEALDRAASDGSSDVGPLRTDGSRKAGG